MSKFSDLNLAEPVHRALERLGYTQPTPIQTAAIPPVLKGKDLLGIAQTGTGKTAAFSLPLLSHLIREERELPKRGARALILAPTRELAAQIAVSVRDYGVCIPTLRVACVFGGVPIARQIKTLVRGNDVLVATPGRLLDLISRKDVRLDDVEVLILDEADQMMDMGFIHALKKIVPHLPKDRQTLFFSATMTPPIKKLAKQFLTDPVHVSVSPPNTTAEKVEQSVIYVNTAEKQDLLALTLLNPDINRALIFTRTKHGADRVVKRLASVGIEALAIHGNKSQNQRQRALAALREGRVKFLIATDIAARGIDIEGISHVINFEIPNVPEQYVHRIGRTARAGRSGLAISFVGKDEKNYLKDIQKLLGITLPVMPLPDGFNSKANDVNKRPALPKPAKPEKKAEQKSAKSQRGKRSNKSQSRRERKANTEAKSVETDRPRRDKNRKPKRDNRPPKQNEAKDISPRSESESRSDGEYRLRRKPRNNSSKNVSGNGTSPNKSQNTSNKNKNKRRKTSNGRPNRTPKS